MVIANPYNYITVQDFKDSDIYDAVLFDEVATPDSAISMAISIASRQINTMCGNSINTKWNSSPSDEWKNLVQLATLFYVRNLASKGVDWLRGSATFSEGGVASSQTNPDDPMWIPPETLGFLQQAGELVNTYLVSLPQLNQDRTNIQCAFSGNGYEPISWNQALNTFWRKNGVASTDNSVSISYLSSYENNFTVDLKITAETIANAIINNPTLLSLIVSQVVHSPELIPQIVASAEFKQAVYDEIVLVLENDVQLQQAIETAIEQYIINDPAFVNAITQSVENLIATDPAFVTKISDALLADQAFLDSIKNGTETAILADTAFMTSIATTVSTTLLADQAFISSLGNAIKNDASFISSVATAVLALLPFEETKFFPEPPSGTTNKTAWCRTNPASKTTTDNTNMFDLTDYNDDDLLCLSLFVESNSAWPNWLIKSSKCMTKNEWLNPVALMDFSSIYGIKGNSTSMHGYLEIGRTGNTLYLNAIWGLNVATFNSTILPNATSKFYATLTRVGIVGDAEAIPPDNSTIQVVNGTLQAKQFITKTGKYFSETAQGELQTNSTILDQDLATVAKDFRNGINEIYAKVVWSAPLATTSVANNGIQILGTDFDPATEILKVTVNSANLDVGSTQLACIGAVFDTQDWNGVNPRETGVDGFGANTGGSSTQAALSGFQLIKNVNNYEIRLYKRANNTVSGTTPQPLVGDIVVRKAKI